tara:strand:- start:613 stop:1350 length:738 start_codon:yes stop_codon:yes gene_type:complete
MIKKIKDYFRYSFLHYLFLNFKNPKYISWLKEEYLFHKKFLDKESMIFDLGANLGDKTHIFLKFSKKVICYEPENKMFNILSHRFKTKRVVVNKKIISNKEKNLKFLIPKDNEAYSTINEKSLKQFKHISKNKISSQIKKSTTINKEITKFGKPNYIKIDCEGAEKKILENLNFKIKIISFELNLPYFYKDGKKILNYFSKKFNSKFNIRIHDEFKFKFKKNVNKKKCLDFLKRKKFTVEIFIFS